ncbi:hypothetical protein A3J90_04740 [candidate division WOR-1 bacterium RIFOXYC2_FULL_37_10]|uniref:Plasmid stabilization protein n=1 Tax=candidate division WOR-1 bacterium RIFOXYB2_FULL_37_13 TaxID=1802579 RepID=A0A1F4SXI3_UNCSA|nr:MAG: hypothetical protein A2246_03100 [candidate division WOR-1 bacterium RIFOXYA2_FULL_37_7]OGC24433.1 MAG: hypothetical protein A2310_08510 [candidate division WOR-1 bacterium RIFOXYB2_FULL_37_13]OGC35531.1 MAG: hypothetical protein A3J90_04740 [candidate division WOR-1 bacterium RIFOXYC2_FULL_37_10]
MIYFFKPSFKRLFKKLQALKRDQVLEAIEALKIVLESKKSIEGLGLKLLSNNIWEIRSSLKDRIIFTFDDEIITFVLVGNHDEVKRYLKNL